MAAANFRESSGFGEFENHAQRFEVVIADNVEIQARQKETLGLEG